MSEGYQPRHAAPALEDEQERRDYDNSDPCSPQNTATDARDAIVSALIADDERIWR